MRSYVSALVTLLQIFQLKFRVTFSFPTCVKPNVIPAVVASRSSIQIATRIMTIILEEFSGFNQHLQENSEVLI